MVARWLVVGEIINGGGDHPHIQHCTTGGMETRSQPVAQSGGVGAGIVADSHDFVSTDLLPQMIADELDALFVQFFVEDTADVVFSENRFWNEWMVFGGWWMVDGG